VVHLAKAPLARDGVSHFVSMKMGCPPKRP
jgi:hypothetical protein